MTNKISRRNVLAGAVSAGLAAGSMTGAPAQAQQRSTETKLPDVWGQDFLYQWSPPANVKRDRDTDRRLSEAGWRVVRIWEHEDPAEASERVIREVRPYSSL